MTDKEKLVVLLDEIAEYFRECRENASPGSKARAHFRELQDAAAEASRLLGYQAWREKNEN